MAIMPEFGILAKEGNFTEKSEHEINIVRDGKGIILLARLTPAPSSSGGSIITFDDITSLVSAKRTAAWADIARRVAHEIKNPLTPIQLSAERLKRKFEPVAAEEKENFNRYLETITRHVADIGRMVEEFVGFARMPSAKPTNFDLIALTKKIMFTQETAHPEIQYSLTSVDSRLGIHADEGYIGQLLTNLMKNAAESLANSSHKDLPEIMINLGKTGDKHIIEVSDNGDGFQEDILHRLTEPYVTTKEKGTGLGLAIVKKITEEHGGKLSFANITPHGAKVTVVL